jgi:hypothetical protein
LKLTFLFFAGIFQLTPPSLPLAYPPPPSFIHAAQIRPKKHKKQPPRNSTGAAFTYSFSIFQLGFALAAKATKELNTRFHRLSTRAHPNKSGVIFAAFIWLYRDIIKTICNPLRPCFITYKRLHRIGGYKIAACAAVLFPCVYHALHPR